VVGRAGGCGPNLARVGIAPGLSAKLELKVSESDTAIAFASGDVPVLATPRLIALIEEAAVKATERHLRPGETSVGMRVQFDHLQPTAVGSTVMADAVLEKVEGRRLIFTVTVADACGLVAAGKVTRVVVDRDGFLEKAR
jgi:fluoroacetyl-CoA thioesterase